MPRPTTSVKVVFENGEWLFTYKFDGTWHEVASVVERAGRSVVLDINGDAMWSSESERYALGFAMRWARNVAEESLLLNKVADLGLFI